MDELLRNLARRWANTKLTKDLKDLRGDLFPSTMRAGVRARISNQDGGR